MLPMPKDAPDAIRCPHNYRVDQVSGKPSHSAFRDEFGPLLARDPKDRSKLVYARLWPPTGEWLITAYAHHPNGVSVSLMFPSDHPRNLQDRYEWFDRGTGDGVQYGFLVPDETSPEAVEKFRSELAEKWDAFLATDAGRQFLTDRKQAIADRLVKLGKTPDEMDEYLASLDEASIVAGLKRTQLPPEANS